MRSDIRDGKEGVPSTLDIVLTNANSCAPRAGASVDIWHCDALGVYSGFAQMADLPPPAGFDPRAPGFAPPNDAPPAPPSAAPPDFLPVSLPRRNPPTT